MDRGGVPSERLRSLLDAVVAMSSDLTLDGALQSIVDSASRLVDAEYGFLGVLDGTASQRVGRHAVHGLDERHQQMIGGLPEGRGVLGTLIDHPEPVRVSRLADHPRRAGFPARHPEMTSFLGVPIRIHDVVFGNLYLANKRSGEGFTVIDEEIAVALAGAAGVAIENARLYEQAESRRRWLEATADIAVAMHKPMSRGAAHQLIVERARDVSGADAAALLVPDARGRQIIRVVTGAPRDISGREATMPWVDEIVATGEPAVSLDVPADERVDPAVTETMPQLRAMHGQPFPLDEGTAVLVLGWLDGNHRRVASLDPTLPRGFAHQAALALQVVRARENASRLAVFEDRDRIGRDLHDLVIQRLFAAGLLLDSTARSTDQATALRLAEAVDDLDLTIEEIRRTIFGLTTPVTPGVVRDELEQIARETERLLGFSPVVSIHGDVDREVTDVVAEQLVAVLHETTSNVVRHSGAQRVELVLDVTDDHIVLQIIDDGRGLDPDALLGNGMRNLCHRAKALGGQCDFEQPESGGVRVRWSVPKENHG